MENNNDVFLKSFRIKLEAGEYDDQMTLPFMNKKLVYAAVKGKVQRKMEKGAAPILTDAEIKGSIEDAKATSGSTFYLMVKHGILEEKEDGTYGLSKRGVRALKEISLS